MSKVQLQGNLNGTGIFTIASPNSNTDRVINLPDAAGTLQVSGNPISGTTGTFTGLLDISAAGAGQIKFPATANLSSNANTLDDYEEGTWTPSIKFGGNSAGMTYNEQIGTYIIIGRIGIISMVITLTAKGSSTGQATLTGLPFSVQANARGGQVGATFSTFAATVYGLGFYASGTTIELVGMGSGGSFALDQSHFNNTSAWRMTGVYILD